MRNIKLGTAGSDVREVKDMLFAVGAYDKSVKKITHNTFGHQSVAAAKDFQLAHHLVVDGIVGRNTLAALKAELAGETDSTDYIPESTYPRISDAVRKKLNAALGNVSEVRRDIVLEALRYATDATVANKYNYPSSLYIRGGNLYDTKGKLNVITLAYLTGSYAKTYASYCTNGRLEMMKKAVSNDPTITGADCSGGIIGLLRHFKLIGAKVDATANGLLGSGYSKSVSRDNLMAGDFVGKNGHICLYVGGGYMVEWAGGEYGCQITNVSDRRCWSYTKKRMVSMAACTKYRRPIMY